LICIFVGLFTISLGIQASYIDRINRSPGRAAGRLGRSAGTIRTGYGLKAVLVNIFHSGTNLHAKAGKIGKLRMPDLRLGLIPLPIRGGVNINIVFNHPIARGLSGIAPKVN
jgi:hypothetical protein